MSDMQQYSRIMFVLTRKEREWLAERAKRNRTYLPDEVAAIVRRAIASQQRTRRPRKTAE
jgi:hypothetical protein